MDYTGHYCVMINRTQYNGSWIIKWDLYDHNLSKLKNSNQVHCDLDTCANITFYSVWSLLRHMDVKFVTIVTNWEDLINLVYDRTGQELPNYIAYFKELFVGYNYIVLNVFDTEVFNEFYSY